jgi:hypothetical protein
MTCPAWSSWPSGRDWFQQTSKQSLVFQALFHRIGDSPTDKFLQLGASPIPRRYPRQVASTLRCFLSSGTQKPRKQTIEATAFHSRVSSGIAALAALVLLLLPVSEATALSRNRLSLVDMISQSEHILVGKVTALSEGFTDQRVPFTEINLDVEASLKGDIGPDYRFRQFGLMDPSGVDNSLPTAFKPTGLPRWQLGEDVVVFLQRPAHLTGFQPTVGLEQGKLRRVGNRIESEGRNGNLLEGIAVSDGLRLSERQRALLDHPTCRINADDFLDLLSTALAEHWVKRGMITNAN